MRNGQKAGRVAHVFVVHLRNEFLWEQFCFSFLLTAVRFIQISVFTFQTFDHGVSDIFMSSFQMELNDYPHFDLVVDGRLCSTGQNCPVFPRVLYDTLVRLGYDGDAPVYHCRLSTAHAWTSARLT
jgi:hypothetical protein